MKLASALGLGVVLFTLGWGGRAPINWGLEDGITDTIPATDDRYHWYAYNSGVDDETWDQVALAVATIDAEVPKFRWLYHVDGTTYGPGHVLVSVSVKSLSDPVPPECQDTEEGTSCVLGMAECLANTTSGSYDLCSHYRVNLYWGRILANTAARHPEQDPLDVLFSVTRHELTHVLGFRHGTGGPMVDGDLPLTPCQVDMLNYYNFVESWSAWSYGVPSDCD